MDSKEYTINVYIRINSCEDNIDCAAADVVRDISKALGTGVDNIEWELD